MPAPLRCPTCSAPLDLPPAYASTVRCTYCGAAVLLSERAGQMEAAAAQQRHADAIAEVLAQLRAGSKIGAVKVYRDHFGVGLKEAKDAVERLEQGQSAGSFGAPPPYDPYTRPAARNPPPSPFPAATGPRVGLGGVIAVLLFAGLIVGSYLQGRGSGEDVATPAPSPATTQTPAAAQPEPPAAPSFAEEVMRFGAEGTGAGRFEDTRSVAVDGAGRIYTAEYTGGRVQVFDSAGTFLTQWQANRRMPLLALAADRDGTVYIIQSGRIQRYEGATGRALGPIAPARGMGYEDVTVALDGSLWTVSDNAVVHLSRDGAVRRRINLKRVVDEDAAPERVAVAGSGDLYVLDKWKATVYHLSPDGRFVDRFGGGGFPPLEDVAVDGRGRVYVTGLGGPVIHVFDAAGQPVAEFGGGGVVFGIVFNDRDELFAAYRNDHQIAKFRIPR
jgi:DNA-directed RNA polymerase subunit RPC12/RpoP